MQPEEENRHEEPIERIPTETPEAPEIYEERAKKAKGKRRIDVKIPEFSPKLDSLDLDPPDIYTRKQKIKK